MQSTGTGLATAASTEAIDGMAMLGKTALSLLFIVGLILALSYLVKRINARTLSGDPLLKQIASTSLGPKERVVVVEIDDTWLVLGVGGGQISKLHETTARERPGRVEPQKVASDFAGRLAGALSRSDGAAKAPKATP